MEENTVYTETTEVEINSDPEVTYYDLDEDCTSEKRSTGKDTFIGILIGAGGAAAVVGVKKLIDKRKAEKQTEKEPKKKFHLPFGKKKDEQKIIEGEFEEIEEEAESQAEEAEVPAKKPAGKKKA